MKKLLKMRTHGVVEIAYENRAQFLRRKGRNIEEFAQVRLCKTLWNTCRNLADKEWKNGGKGPREASRTLPCNFL